MNSFLLGCCVGGRNLSGKNAGSGFDGGGGRILYIVGCGSHLERFRKIFVRSGMKVSFCKNLTEEFIF